MILGTIHVQGIPASRVVCVNDTLSRLGWTARYLDPEDDPNQLCFTQELASEEDRETAVNQANAELPYGVRIVFGGGPASLE
jgi:hypothetical protein